MRKAPCADLAELRSAFVDGALDNSDRERLLGHLVDCAHCRQADPERPLQPLGVHRWSRIDRTLVG